MAEDGPARFLVLLPPLSSPTSHGALKAAFGDTLTQLLKEVATHTTDATTGPILEVGMACSHLVRNPTVARSTVYSATQALVAGVYKLVCVIAAREGINIEDSSGVDVRVLLIAWNVNLDSDQQSNINDNAIGPVVSLQTLALSRRSWQFAFGVESEAGEAMIKAFVAAKGSGGEITHVHSESSSHSARGIDGSTQPRPNDPKRSGRKHYHVAVGGTFDHIHIGHKLLLTMTMFALDEEGATGERSVIIGITGDQLLVNKKHAEQLESWAERQQSTARFVDAIVDFTPLTGTIKQKQQPRDDPSANGKSVVVTYPGGLVVKYPEIQDTYGPTVTEERISALVLSAETRAGGEAINEKRKEKGFATLEVFEVDVLDAEEGTDSERTKTSFESKLSSTAIREKLARKTQSSL